MAADNNTIRQVFLRNTGTRLARTPAGLLPRNSHQLLNCSASALLAQAQADRAINEAPSTVRPLARDPRVLIGWPLPLGFGLDGRLLLARRGRVYV